MEKVFVAIKIYSSSTPDCEGIATFFVNVTDGAINVWNFAPAPTILFWWKQKFNRIHQQTLTIRYTVLLLGGVDEWMNGHAEGILHNILGGFSGCMPAHWP